MTLEIFTPPTTLDSVRSPPDKSCDAGLIFDADERCSSKSGRAAGRGEGEATGFGLLCAIARRARGGGRRHTRRHRARALTVRVDEIFSPRPTCSAIRN